MVPGQDGTLGDVRHFGLGVRSIAVAPGADGGRSNGNSSGRRRRDSLTEENIGDGVIDHADGRDAKERRRSLFGRTLRKLGSR